DNQGRVWVEGSPGGFFVYDGASWQQNNFGNLGLNLRVNDVEQAPNGDIWAAAQGGAVHYSAINQTWTHYNSITTNGLWENTYTSLDIAPDGTIIFGGTNPNRVYTYDGNSYQTRSLPINHNSIFDILDVSVHESDDFYVHVEARGIFHYEQGAFQSIYFSINDDIWDITVDTAGNCWAAMKDSIGYYDGNSWQFFKQNDLPFYAKGIDQIGFDRLNNMWVSGLGFIANLRRTNPSPTYQLGGMVFYDANSNGQKDSGEVGIA
ncbi:MAG: hypothetical protein AAFN81_35065, partial [Bacteroidota bacterium]